MNEATRILAIRHGQTAWNAAARIQGHTDIELDDTGQWQARRVAQALGDEDLQAIYSSDLARARDTAAPLAALHGLPVGIDEGLRERGFGDFEGLSFEQIEARWPDQALAWRRRDPAFGPRGGEVLRDLHQMMFRDSELAGQIVDRLHLVGGARQPHQHAERVIGVQGQAHGQPRYWYLVYSILARKRIVVNQIPEKRSS